MSQGQYQMSNVPAPDELAAMHQLGERIDSYPYQKVQGIIVIIVFLFKLTNTKNRMQYLIANTLIFLLILPPGFSIQRIIQK